MKKLLTLSMLLAALAFIAPAAEAKNATDSAALGSSSANLNAAAQTYRVRRNRRGAYVTTRTRLVRVGRRIYRETYRVRYLPNGRTRINLISRVRIR